MTDSKFEMTAMEIDEIHPINPEIASHNIALAYVQSALQTEGLPLGELMSADSIIPIAVAYSDVYNYAYNFITHENKIIDKAE